MAALTVNRDMEALVDLFLSPNFDPFELPDVPAGVKKDFVDSGDILIACGPAKQHICFDILPSPKGGIEYHRAPLHPSSVPPRVLALHFHSNVVPESEIEDNTQEEEGIQPPGNNDFTKHCGQILARLGDQFFQTYVPSETAPSAAGRPWENVSERIKSVLNKAAQINETDPNYEQEKEKVWTQFKEIMSNSISDTAVSDVYKQLGAILLTLRGLSDVGSGAVGWARTFYLRYIRDRHMDSDMQRLGGLNRLVSQEVD